MKNPIFIFFKIALLTILIIALTVLVVDAQCPMCRMSAEANLKDGGSMAAGLNRGIIYLLIIPYVLIGTIGFLWWRNKRAVQDQEQEEEIKGLLEPHDVVLTSTEFNETVES
jgi:heme/copper-type cytochrome/quinol oxidase subunit 2